MAYSIDFRRKILEIKERDSLSFEETAARFGISKSSVSRWSKRLEPCQTRNKPATKIDMERLVRDVEEYPDAYQHERAERFGCMQSARHMRRIETAEDQLKKRSPDKEIRSRFKKKLSVYELMRIPLIYIDESGFAEDMPRTFGYAPEGRRNRERTQSAH